MGSSKTTTATAVGVAAAGAAAAAVRKLADRGTNEADQDLTRWRVVTVARPLDDFPGGTPGPLADLGEAVEVRTQAAPGDKGTELFARWRDGSDLSERADPVRELRVALRDAKQVLEVGWVLRPDRNVTTEETPLNAPLRKAIKLAKGEGLL
ncbi:hypothetical protein [Cellulomonas sp. URHD0024]|uniref:hypothetical protein n=1 Tax=Cellulomonas sp. URHD0024 TaxID=1302620 RepID=UPI00040B3482|nr:hypothetical protein [Cellulomonas sp. URHD0024]